MKNVCPEYMSIECLEHCPRSRGEEIECGECLYYKDCAGCFFNKNPEYPENPVPLKIYNLPPPTQKVQPYQFGDPFSKATLLWLVGLSPLKPTKVLSRYVPYLPSYTSRNKGDNTKSGAAGHNQKKRSRFFPGIAEAMATQWSI